MGGWGCIPREQGRCARPDIGTLAIPWSLTAGLWDPGRETEDLLGRSSKEGNQATLALAGAPGPVGVKFYMVTSSG